MEIVKFFLLLLCITSIKCYYTTLNGDNASFQRLIIDQKGILIYFSKTYCGKCHDFEQNYLPRIAKKYPSLRIYKFDTLQYELPYSCPKNLNLVGYPVLYIKDATYRWERYPNEYNDFKALTNFIDSRLYFKEKPSNTFTYVLNSTHALLYSLDK